MSRASHTGYPALVLALLLPLSACGGRAINKKTARDLIVKLPGEIFEKDDVVIEAITQTGPGDAVVETRLRTAFRLERVSGKWQIRGVRVGSHHWESVDNLIESLERMKEEETRKMIETVEDAVWNYRRKTGRIPDFKDYVSLSDTLSPEYMNPLIRLDAWERPLAAFRLDSNTIRILSAGRDGKLDTADDIGLSRRYP